MRMANVECDILIKGDVQLGICAWMVGKFHIFDLGVAPLMLKFISIT